MNYWASLAPAADPVPWVGRRPEKCRTIAMAMQQTPMARGSTRMASRLESLTCASEWPEMSQNGGCSPRQQYQHGARPPAACERAECKPAAMMQTAVTATSCTLYRSSVSILDNAAPSHRSGVDCNQTAAAAFTTVKGNLAAMADTSEFGRAAKRRRFE